MSEEERGREERGGEGGRWRNLGKYSTAQKICNKLPD